MSSKVLNVQVSNTTKDDSSNSAEYIIVKLLKAQTGLVYPLSFPKNQFIILDSYLINHN
jgi:hypothetical protein